MPIVDNVYVYRSTLATIFGYPRLTDRVQESRISTTGIELAAILTATVVLYRFWYYDIEELFPVAYE